MSVKDLFCLTQLSPVVLIIVAILWCVDVGIVIFCIGQGFKHIYPNTKLQNFYKRSYWLNLITFGIFLFMVASSGVFCRSDNVMLLVAVFLVILIFAFASQISVLYGIIGRVYYTFKGSSYEISETLFFRLKLHCIGIFSASMMSFTFLVIGEFLGSDAIHPLEWKFFSGIFLVIGIVYYWIVSWKCVGLFVSKIMKIVVTAMNSVRDITKVKTLRINEKQDKFLNTITKHIVLASVKLFGTIFAAIILLITICKILTVTLSNKKTERERRMSAITGFTVFAIIGLIDVGVTVFTMYLHYQFSSHIYVKLCGKCNKCTKWRYKKKAGCKMTARAISLHESQTRDKTLSVSDNNSTVNMTQSSHGQ